jgi:hypothetical protein
MVTVVSSFADRPGARRAADALVQQGFAPDSIRLHAQPEPANSTAVKIDEVATGGFVHNFQNLLDGLFNTDSFRDEAAHYGDVVRQGGIVLAVEAADAAQARAAITVLERTGGASPRSVDAKSTPA